MSIKDKNNLNSRANIHETDKLRIEYYSYLEKEYNKMVEKEKNNEIKLTQFEMDLQSTQESVDCDNKNMKTLPFTVKYITEMNSKIKIRSQSSQINSKSHKMYQNINKEDLKRDTRIMYVKRLGNKVIVNNNIETVS